MNSQLSAPDGYISFVVRIWVSDNGKLIRGTIEDASTSVRLAVDFSDIGALLRRSLEHAQERARKDQQEWSEVSEESSSDGKEDGL